jgi:hypothetical protein
VGGLVQGLLCAVAALSAWAMVGYLCTLSISGPLAVGPFAAPMTVLAICLLSGVGVPRGVILSIGVAEVVLGVVGVFLGWFFLIPSALVIVVASAVRGEPR